MLRLDKIVVLPDTSADEALPVMSKSLPSSSGIIMLSSAAQPIEADKARATRAVERVMILVDRFFITNLRM